MGTKLLFLVSLLLATKSLAQERSLLLVEQISLPPKVPNAHERVRASVKEAGRAKGWDVTVQSIDDDSCKPVMKCAEKYARISGIDHVLTLTGTTSKDFSYDLTIELLSTKTNSSQSASIYCEYCDLERMTQNLSKGVGDLLEKNASDLRNRPEEKKPTPIVTPEQPVEAPASKSHVFANTASWIGIGLGAGLLGYGVWALSKDGDEKSCSTDNLPWVGIKRCEYYKTETQGITVGSIGLAMILGGVAWKIFGGDENSTISLSPKHVAYTTRF